MTRSILVVLVVAICALHLCEAYFPIGEAQGCRGGPHDVVRSCGSHCEPSCSQPEDRPCTNGCAVNVCRCQRGFYRRERDNRCVQLNECGQH